MEPTIFADVEDSMFVAKEESFGPIMIVSKFKAGLRPVSSLTISTR